MSRPVLRAALFRAALLGVGAALLLGAPAWAQAHNPFGVGISEGGGAPTGLLGWMMNEQVLFERQLSAAVRASRADGSAALLLAALSFAYGVFHAAGPGHGKAVISSYLFASERALRRGLVLALLAALLQGLMAVALVGVLALGLHATAARLKDAATLVETVSYAAIAVLGLWLVFRKGRALLLALAPAPLGALAFAPAGAGLRASGLRATGADGPGGMAGCGHDLLLGHDASCGHVHAPDPAALGAGFRWREAIWTVAAAGLRPCSGAILVLVFALAQGVFATGILAVTAMSFGVALTTGALASLAVFARGLALRFVPAGSRRGVLALRGLEFGAALLVLLAGLGLLAGYAAAGM